MTTKESKSKVVVKLENELISLKFWVLLASVPLLVGHYISDTTWGLVVTSLLGMRELSEARQNYFDAKNAG